ncbi:MAG: CHAT domain-containing protein [Anaerolineae bacterium]|nr:CHAT domain-containing protein [Anaerolineae bacterium]
MSQKITLSGSLRQLIQEIVATPRVDTLRRIVRGHPELQDSRVDLYLTNCLRSAWNQGDRTGAAYCLAARAFLKRCRDENLEAVLGKPLLLPLGKHSPLAELMELTYEGANLPQRAVLARQALADVRKSGEPELWAALQREVADCLTYSEGPTRAELLEEALEAFRATLEVRGQPSYVGTPVWAQTLQAMAAAYYRRVKGNRAENLWQAGSLYEEALTVFTREAYPEKWAKIQHDLGTLWLEMPASAKIQNIEKAIGYYQAALTVCTREAMPQLWTETTHDLAIAYAEHPGSDQRKNIEKALELGKTVLEVRSPDTNALDWARSHIALGNIYLTRLQGGRMENLEQAIGHYQQALAVLSPNLDSSDRAKACYDLGMALSDRLAGNRISNFNQAIAYFEQALEVFTLKEYPLEWGYVQTGLGYVHHQMGLILQSAENLEQAIVCYENALVVRTPDKDPVGRATVQSHLGNVFADRILGQRAVNQEKALACYKEALQVRTSSQSPSRWAETMNNLGTVYLTRLQGNPLKNRRQAIECFQEVLQVHKPLAFPHYCRRAARNLALVHFECQNWRKALANYRMAIDAGEVLYKAGLSAESKAVELGENAAIYPQAAFATARLKDLKGALLTLERGKTRLLAEVLRLKVMRPPHIPHEVWAEFEQAGAAVRSALYQDVSLPDDKRNQLEAHHTREEMAQSANNALDQAIERIRQYASDFLKELDLPDILALIPDKNTAIITFCLTGQGSMGFIVSPLYSKKVKMIDLPQFTRTTLNRLLFEPDESGRITGGWVGDYLSRDDARWSFIMDDVLAEVGKKLLSPILAGLPPDTKRLILLPSGGLFLLPLHAAMLSDNDSDRLCDRFQVSYAPSAKVLANCRIKAQQATGQKLYAVINPEEDPRLIFTHIEGAAIAGNFKCYQVHQGRFCTKAIVGSSVQGRTYLHFSCHGAYNWNSPSESGLSLADDCLTLADLQSGSIDMAAARLVTLSACETGLTDIVKGSADEYVGLPAGFMLAGVPCVVSSLWSVPDISTAFLMERFYTYHLCGDPNEDPIHRSPLLPVEALHLAQRWLRNLTFEEMCNYLDELVKKGYMPRHQALACERTYDDPDHNRPFESPYYWAAFVIYGA